MPLNLEMAVDGRRCWRLRCSHTSARRRAFAAGEARRAHHRRRALMPRGGYERLERAGREKLRRHVSRLRSFDPKQIASRSMRHKAPKCAGNRTAHRRLLPTPARDGHAEKAAAPRQLRDGRGVMPSSLGLEVRARAWASMYDECRAHRGHPGGGGTQHRPFPDRSARRSSWGSPPQLGKCAAARRPGYQEPTHILGIGSDIIDIRRIADACPFWRPVYPPGLYGDGAGRGLSEALERRPSPSASRPEALLKGSGALETRRSFGGIWASPTGKPASPPSA